MMATSSITKDYYVRDYAAFERLKADLDAASPPTTVVTESPSLEKGREKLASFFGFQNSKFSVCGICGRKLMSKRELCNADPLMAPDSDGDYLGCCPECNQKYVTPIRKVIWNRNLSVSKRYRKKMRLALQKMTQEDYDQLVSKRNIFLALKMYMRRHDRWFKLRRKLGIEGLYSK